MGLGYTTGVIIFGFNILWLLYWIGILFWWETTSFPDQAYFLQIMRYAGVHPFSCIILIYPMMNPIPIIHWILVYFAVAYVFVDLIIVMDIMIHATADLSTVYGKAALAMVWSALGLSIIVLIWCVCVVLDKYAKLGLNCFPQKYRKP